MLQSYKRFLSKGLVAALACGAVALSATAGAQAAYPDKPVTIIIAWSAGGATDSVGRAMQAAFATQLGGDVIIKNIPGAAGTIGTAEAAAGAPDGYTILLTPAGPVSTQPHLRKIPYSLDSFDPVGRVTISPMLMMVTKDSNFKSVQDMVDAAKASPGKVKFASTGAGTLPHISILALDDAAGIKSKHVPFKGSANAVKALLGGVVDVFSDQAQLSPKYDLRPLAAWSAERLGEYPNVPTMTELGYNIVLGNWVGMFVPKGTPDDVSGKIADALSATLKDATVVENFSKLKLEAAPMTRAEFGKFSKDVLKQNGIHLAKAGLIAK